MAEQELTLAVVAVGAKDRMVMRSLLNLANGRSRGPSWRLAEDGHGDLTVVDVDSDAGKDAWEDLHGSPTAIALTADKRFEAPARLHKPLRAREFFSVLERLAGLSGEAEQAPQEPVRQSEPAERQSDDMLASMASGRALADHLRLQTWSGPIVLTQPGWPMLPIDPGSGAWFYDGSISDLEPAQFSRLIPDSAGVALSSAELVERVRGHRQRPLSELKWFAGLAQMPGKLHPDLRGELQFMLAQIPGEAMANEKLHRLAQIVLRGPVTVAELVEQAEQPEANVYAFLNACYASGKLLVNHDWRAAGF